MPAIDAREALLVQVNEMLVHTALVQPAKQAGLNNITAEIKTELRALQAKLTDCDQDDFANLNKWCQEKRSLNRLTNMATTLDALSKVAADQTAKIELPTTDKWQRHSHRLSESEQNAKVAEHLIQHLRTGDTYSKPFAKFLGVEALVKKQLQQELVLEKLKKLEDLAEGLSNVGAKSYDLAGKVMKGAKTATRVVEGSAGLTTSSSALTGFLQAVPVVGAAVTTASMLWQLGESFLKKKGLADNVVKATMVGLAGAALGLSIAFPVAAVAIGAGMVAAGVLANTVKPYFELRKEGKNLSASLDKVKERELELDKPGISLSVSEKKILMQAVEKAYVNQESLTLSDLKTMKAQIQTGDLKAMSASDHFYMALKEDPKKYLQTANRNEQASLSNQIEKIDAKRKTMGAQAINGIFTTAGAVMLAIPFPPVMIAGAALLLASSVVGVIIEYREQIAKAFNAVKEGFKKIFGLDKTPVKEEVKTELANTKSLNVADTIPQVNLQVNKIKTEPLLDVPKIKVVEPPLQVALSVEKTKAVSSEVKIEQEERSSPRPR